MSYLKINTTSTAITVEFDSGDTVVWTIATENACLSQNTPIRVVIREDYFEWSVYDTYMIRHQHDTGASTTGAAFTGNTYCTDANKTQVGSLALYLYPATSTVNTNKTTYAAELAATSTDLTTTGDPVTDRNIPAQIDTTSGFCADGAFHVTSDSNNAGKLTLDRDRALTTVVIEDWPVMTGDPSAPDEYLMFYDKMDLITNGHSPEYSAGGDTVTVNNVSLTLKDGSRGYGVESLNGSFAIPTLDNINVDAGTITFDYFPNSGWGAASRFFFNAKSGSLSCRLNGYTWQFDYGSLQASFSVSTDINFVAGQKYTVSVFWSNSGTASSCGIFINGILKSTVTGTGESFNLDSTMYILNYVSSSTSYDVDGIIDNFKIYSAPILPYGSFIPGDIIYNDEYERAHSDITLYSNTTSLDIGTTSVTNIANIDNSEGSIAFRVEPTTALSSDETLFSAGTNFHIKWDDSNNDIEFTYGTATVRTTTSITAGLDGEHWVDCRYEASGDILLIVDGIEYSASASTAPTLGSAVAWSSNVGMTMRSITSSPSTPQVPTVNGVPVNYPIVKTEVTT